MASSRKRPRSLSHSPSRPVKCIKSDASNEENLTCKNEKLNSKIRDSHALSLESDEDGHLIYKSGDVLNKRYTIIETLGKGTFGQVVHVKDKETNRSIAIKVVRNRTKYREAAEDEISLLKSLDRKDPTGVHLCVKLLSSFFYHGHACMVFEKFGLNLYAFLKSNHRYPYDMDEIRHVAYQLCHSVKFLHDLKVIHTDLKSENIVFVNSDYNLVYDKTKGVNVKRLKRTDIRLIDLGSAVVDKEYHPRIVSTRNFRAPEVILQLGWDQSCDVWSIGCTLFEMYSGNLLFTKCDDVEHLGMMNLILGKIPSRMVEATKTTYFSQGILDWSKSKAKPCDTKQKCKPLMMYKRKKYANHNELFDLIQRMLEYEPSQRITLKEAMSHKFFSKIPARQKLK